MATRYTADEMREMANREKLKCSFVTRTLNGGVILDCTSDVCAMLLHAADLIEREEREKKYEYARVLSDGSISCTHFDEYVKGYYKFRREVGEWEEVTNEEV